MSAVPQAGTEVIRPFLAPALEHYWEDGPEFTSWCQVVGKYPDGTPASVQGSSGKGWVVLCGEEGLRVRRRDGGKAADSVPPDSWGLPGTGADLAEAESVTSCSR